MNIINKVTDEDYIQWIEGFVGNVIAASGIEWSEIVIDSIEWSERIMLYIDGEEYDIRTWDFSTKEYDDNGIPCAETVRYTLFKIVMDDENNGHGEEIDYGYSDIEWVNSEE